MTVHRLVPLKTFCAVVIFFTMTLAQPSWAQLETGWKAHDLDRPLPPSVSPSAPATTLLPPSDADILFDGKNLNQWRDSQGGPSKWKVADGVLIATPKSGSIYTKKKYGDCQLHIEWLIPADTKRFGQSKGNSGVFLMDNFEVQILSTFKNKTYADGMAGAIYGQYPPLVNAAKPLGKWQSYDIIFNRPRFNNDRSLSSPARMTVLHNGVLVQNNSELLGPTAWIKPRPYTQIPDKRSLSLQEHGSPIEFRNIWIREISNDRSQPKQPYPKSKVELTEDQRTRLLGDYGDFQITQTGTQLHCQFFQVKMELLPLSESEFIMKSCAGKLTFDFDQAGQVKQARLELDAAGKRAGPRKAATAK